MSWDLQLMGALVALCAIGVVVPVLVVWGRRAIAFYRVKKSTGAYLPHSTSHKPWTENQFKFPNENQRVVVHRKTRSKKPSRLTLVKERMVSR